ncbi:MAG TPA: glycosyltransferase family 2 protein [Blastocatellia bacterium]|nr:glycosyltransferase family 2 protein [Blastocatellia bacterium]
MLEILWIILGCVLAMATIAGTLELLMLTIAGLLPRRRVESTKFKLLNLAVVIPAHNEEASIARCIRSLHRCERARSWFSIVVVADNCTDSTAEVARENGARALIRNDATKRGKGYALDFAFKTLIKEGFEEFIVIDADSEVEPNMIHTFRELFEDGADAIQCRYTVNNADVSIRTRLMNVALLAFNVLRPRGRDRLGFSVGLLGNGFGLTRDTLVNVPYDAVSVVEDLEYHIRLVRAGRKVRFADGTSVKAEMPTGGKGARTQRARWEGGRFRTIASSAPGLAVRVLKGELNLIEPLFELLLLPLAFHVLLLLAALIPPFAPSRIYAAAGLGVVALHIVAALWVGGGGFKDIWALACAPFYIVWKAALLPKMLLASKKDAEWVRTERAGTEGGRV